MKNVPRDVHSREAENLSPRCPRPAQKFRLLNHLSAKEGGALQGGFASGFFKENHCQSFENTILFKYMSKDSYIVRIFRATVQPGLRIRCTDPMKV